MNFKIVDTIREATGGQLLSAKDFFVGTVWFSPITPTTYKMELYSNWENPDNRNIIHAELIQIEKTITSMPAINIPAFKGFYVKEIAAKWYLPDFYNYVAHKYNNHECSPKLRYEKSVALFNKSAELYKSLVLELMPLFQEEDREAVKHLMLGHAIGELIRFLRREVILGITEDMKDKKKEFGISGIPQKTIDKWIANCNIADAWIAESLPYRKAYQLDYYNESKLQFKLGITTSMLATHPDYDKRTWYMSPTSTMLKEFLNERELALNPPLHPLEKINVKVHPVSMMFAHGSQLASKFISNACLPNISADNSERVRLLDQLGDYTPKYCAPRAGAANPGIDNQIMQDEKSLIHLSEQINITNVKELDKAIVNAIKLFSLVHMRYKNSLNTKNDYSYFSIFKTDSSIDKDNYYEIFSFYLENIFQKYLIPLLKITTSNKLAFKDEYQHAIEAVNFLVEHSYNVNSIDSVTARTAVRILSDIKKISGIESAVIQERDDVKYGMRHRNIKKVTPV